MWEIIADKPKQKSAPSFRRQVALRDLSAQILSKLLNPRGSNQNLLRHIVRFIFRLELMEVRTNGATQVCRSRIVRL